jgi:hypothetical protein
MAAAAVAEADAVDKVRVYQKANPGARVPASVWLGTAADEDAKCEYVSLKDGTVFGVTVDILCMNQILKDARENVGLFPDDTEPFPVLLEGADPDHIIRHFMMCYVHRNDAAELAALPATTTDEAAQIQEFITATGTKPPKKEDPLFIERPEDKIWQIPSDGIPSDDPTNKTSLNTMVDLFKQTAIANFLDCQCVLSMLMNLLADFHAHKTMSEIAVWFGMPADTRPTADEEAAIIARHPHLGMAEWLVRD